MKSVVQCGKTVAGWLLVVCAGSALATEPYHVGNKLDTSSLEEAVTQTAEKLQSSGFTVVGTHRPTGVADHAIVVATDAAMLDAIRTTGGAVVAGAGIRVGVKADGTLTYMNPDYWYRAYFRDKFSTVEPTVKSLDERLQAALGKTGDMGGDVDEEDLADYNYMMGMEKFDDDTLLTEASSFEAAVKTIQDNLAAGVGKTAKVYEIILPEQQIAVFGVAFNDVERGEGWWVNKIGTENIAGLPYEIFVVGKESHAMFARYRLAIAWPSLGMGTFMGISKAPGIIYDTLFAVAGGVDD